MEYIILFGLLAVLLAIGVPVAFSLLAATLATVLYLALPPIVVFQQMGSDITSVALLAIPLALMRTSQQKDYAYTIKIKNSHQTPVQLILEDVIPISANKDIEVNEVKLGSASLVNDKGLIRWKLDLAANGSQEVGYSFSVKYPKNKTVGNL